VPQLPRVAVLGAHTAGLAALHGLVDGGMPAVAFGLLDSPADADAPADALAEYADRFGLDDRVRRAPAPPEVTVPGGGAARFAVRAGDGPEEPFDAIVAAGAGYLAAALSAAGLPGAPRLYLGVFHPRDAGIFAVGASGGSALAEAQGRLIGEYLRGRYLPPSPPAEGTGWRRPADRAGAYLRALRRELRAGHARAAAAGYPLPVPRA
jgi:hypothetical protein